MIKFSDQLSQDNYYLTFAIKILVTYTIIFLLTLISCCVSFKILVQFCHTQ